MLRRLWASLGLALLMLLTAQGGVSDLPERLNGPSAGSFSEFRLELSAAVEAAVVGTEASLEAPHGPHLPALAAELETAESETEDDDSAHERVVIASAAELAGSQSTRVLHAHSDASRVGSDPQRSLPFARGPPLSA